MLLAITGLSTMASSYFYKDILLFTLTQSFYDSDSLHSMPSYFIFTDVTEIFAAYIQLITFLSLQAVVFYMMYHIFAFFSPAFFGIEHRYLSLVLKVVKLVWLFSALFSHCFLIPLTWNFFLSFQNLTSVSLFFEAKLVDCVSLYITLYYLGVFYCQIFVVLFFFTSYMNVNALYIKKFRKLYYYFFIVFSTLLSPPEVFSQIVLSFIVICIYEFFIFSFMIKILLYK